MSTANDVSALVRTLSINHMLQEQQSTTSRSGVEDTIDVTALSSQIAVELEPASLQEQVAVNVLKARTNGQIDDAIAGVAEKFLFKEYGLGLEFNDRNGLTEFFQKARELYPESLVEIGAVFASGDRVIAEWTLNTTLSEPFVGGLTRRIRISLRGVSIVRVEDGKITEWADYYDGLTARRTALASYFTEWVEL
jgi:steroid delta-isomerase-like uncharacterized protein